MNLVTNLVIMVTLTVAPQYGAARYPARGTQGSNYIWVNPSLGGGLTGGNLMARSGDLQLNNDPSMWTGMRAPAPGLAGRMLPVPKKPMPMSQEVIIPLPSKPGWECSKNYEKHPLPHDCTGLYTCKKCAKSPNGWCYTPSRCEKGSFFDDRAHACVYGNQCPQSLSELPTGWSCDIEGEHHVVPTDCKQYYQCVECTKPSGWCYETVTCPEGKWFDDRKKVCVDNRCPQAPKILPPGWPCAVDGSLHVVPTDCAKSYRCYACEDGPWCYDGEQSCPFGQTFDDVLKICVHGRCPQFPEINPPTWQCTQDGEKHVVPHNCSSYYTCMKCPDFAPWCHTMQGCPSNQTFDDKNKRCTDGRCPQYPPVIPENWNCTKETQKNVHPEDCSKFYVCHRFKGEWTFTENQCPTGGNFDDAKKMCVSASCPQEPPLLPEGWKCGQDGEKHAHPDDCIDKHIKICDLRYSSQFYTCNKSANATDWSYTLEQCPNDQNFNEGGGSCQDGRCPQHPPALPAGFECKNDGELKVHPESCEEYYKCIKFQEKDWTYELKKCGVGRTFNDKKQACVAGRCPQYPPKLINGWKCGAEHELNQLPKDCSQYYKCINCPDGGWCYEQFKCGPNTKFDSKSKQCTKDDITCEGASGSSSSSSSEEGVVVPTPVPVPAPAPIPMPLPILPVTGPLGPSILPGKQKCVKNGQKHAIQNECQCYHLCISSMFELRSVRLCCKNGKYFDRQRHVCTKGVCPYKGLKPGILHAAG